MEYYNDIVIVIFVSIMLSKYYWYYPYDYDSCCCWLQAPPPILGVSRLSLLVCTGC